LPRQLLTYDAADSDSNDKERNAARVRMSLRQMQADPHATMRAPSSEFTWCYSMKRSAADHRLRRVADCTYPYYSPTQVRSSNQIKDIQGVTLK